MLAWSPTRNRLPDKSALQAQYPAHRGQSWCHMPVPPTAALASRYRRLHRFPSAWRNLARRNTWASIARAGCRTAPDESRLAREVECAVSERRRCGRARARASRIWRRWRRTATVRAETGCWWPNGTPAGWSHLKPNGSGEDYPIPRQRTGYAWAVAPSWWT